MIAGLAYTRARDGWQPPTRVLRCSNVRKLRIPWTRITLYSAGDPNWTSHWDPTLNGACECFQGGERRGADVTEAHLAALAELRDHDSCANWYTDAAREDRGPKRDDIDWRGFDWGEQHC